MYEKQKEQIKEMIRNRNKESTYEDMVKNFTAELAGSLLSNNIEQNSNKFIHYRNVAQKIQRKQYGDGTSNNSEG